MTEKHFVLLQTVNLVRIAWLSLFQALIVGMYAEITELRGETFLYVSGFMLALLFNLSTFPLLTRAFQKIYQEQNKSVLIWIFMLTGLNFSALFYWTYRCKKESML